MRRISPALLIGTAVLLPFNIASAASPTTSNHATPKSSNTTTHSTATKHTTAKKATKTKPVVTRTIQGPGVDMMWGTVQVTIIVKGNKVVDVQTQAPNERARSAYINSIAVPYLRQETLQAQSANIDLISGATMTSEAFAQSLQAALDSAHL